MDSFIKKEIDIPCEAYETDILIKSFFLFCSVNNVFLTYNFICNEHTIKDITVQVGNITLPEKIRKKWKKQGKNQEGSADKKQGSNKIQGNEQANI